MSLCWQMSIQSKLWFFSSTCVQMWELDHRECWALKNWCFEIVVLEKTLETSLDSKEIKPVNLKIISPEYSLERLMLRLKYSGWLTGKDLDAGKDWQQAEKGATEDKMVGWHHRLNRHKCEQIPGDSEGQGSLSCCSSPGCKESDTT